MENDTAEEHKVGSGAYAAGDNATALGERAVYARDAGTIITGDSNAVYIGFEQEVDWEKVDYKKACDVVKNAFIEHMLRFAGAADGNDAFARYEPLFLQKSSFTTTADTRSDVSETEKKERPVFIWEKYIQYPSNILLVGEAGAGKTTLLLHAAQSLARQADDTDPLPIYISLSSYNGRTTADLIKNVADASGLDVPVVAGILREVRKPVCLFLDGADELQPQDIEKLLKDIFALFGESGEQQHSIVISSRHGKSMEAILSSALEFEQWELLPLSRELIEVLLDRYGLAELNTFADLEFLDVLQTPDLLSALSQGLRGKVHAGLPKSVGQIYQLYVDSHLTRDAKSSYDYYYVVRPLLGHIAVTLMEQQRNRLIIKDDTATQLIQVLTTQIDRYQRLRQLAPPNWNLSSLLLELEKSPFVSLQKTQSGDYEVLFTKQGYRDYFAALYMSEEGNRNRIIEALQADERQAWLQALFMMAGINKGANPLLETFYELSTDYGIDIWMQSRPIGLKSPEVVFNRAKEMFDHRASLKEGRYNEPITTRIISKMLDDQKPRTRFAAARAISQWGIDGIVPLLDAVDDENPLVNAVAIYALLHLGETSENADQNGPLPPLMSIDDEFHFSNVDGGGGVIGRIGPITLVSSSYGQSTNKTELSLHIESMDFDPFEVPSYFSLFHNGPVWFAHNWFRKRKKVDWIDLLAQLNWLVYLTDQANERALQKDSVIQEALGDKRNQFLYLARLVEKDLGCKPLLDNMEYDLSDDLKKKIERDYQQFRHMYKLDMRRKFLSPPDGQTVNRSSYVELAISSDVLGLLLEGMKIRSSYPARPDDRLFAVSADQYVEVMEAGKATAIGIQALHEGQELLPTYLELKSKMYVESAENCLLQGVAIDNLFSNNGGVSISADIYIERFRSSRLQGVYVDQLVSAESISEMNTQLEQLRIELEKSPELDAALAEAVFETARGLIEISSSEQFNRTLIRIKSEGLNNVAEEAADVAPGVKVAVDNILKTVKELADI